MLQIAFAWICKCEQVDVTVQVLSPQFYKFGSMIPSILSAFCFLLFPTSPLSNILATSFIFLRQKTKKQKYKNKNVSC